jgi:hypothetical protein
MKKSILRGFGLLGAITLMSFSEPLNSEKESSTSSSSSASRPMFGGKEECMPPVRTPGGECRRNCRQHTYIFWIDFVGEWHEVGC